MTEIAETDEDYPFWLGALSNMGERGQRSREEIGFLFFTRLSRSFARVFALRSSVVLPTKPPSYAGLTRADVFPFACRRRFCPVVLVNITA